MTRSHDLAAARLFDHQTRMFDEALTGQERVADLEVVKTTVAWARPYIAGGHYSGTMPDSTMEVFAGMYGHSVAGVVTFGMGANRDRYSALIPDIENGQYRELTRLWVDDRAPRNTASRLIAASLRLLPPGIRIVISYADSEQGHVGFIYQATNFHYCGMTDGGNVILDSDGRLRHSRLISMYRKKRPELRGVPRKDILRQFGWQEVRTSPKHRYVLLLGPRNEKRRMTRTLEPHIVRPYPKTAAGGHSAWRDTA